MGSGLMPVGAAPFHADPTSIRLGASSRPRLAPGRGIGSFMGPTHGKFVTSLVICSVCAGVSAVPNGGIDMCGKGGVSGAPRPTLLKPGSATCWACELALTQKAAPAMATNTLNLMELPLRSRMFRAPLKHTAGWKIACTPQGAVL